MKSYGCCLTVLSCLLLASGCGSGVVSVDALEISTTLERDCYEDLAQVKIAVDDFECKGLDAEEDRIGEAKTGMFNCETPIVSDKSVGVIVADAIRQAVQQVGLELVDSPPADFIIQGKVERLWVDEYATGMSLEYSKASVVYDLMLVDASGQVKWANTMDVYKVSKTDWDATCHNLPTLSDALEESVKQLFGDSSFRAAVKGGMPKPSEDGSSQ